MKTQTPAGRSWRPEEIRQRIKELGDWFHNIDVNGIQTAPEHFLGDYPAVKWNTFAHAIPPDLTGKSVLDIGCNAGFYSLEMKRRGAELVVGIDSDPDYLAQARFVAEVTGLQIEFQQISVYEVARLGRRFDVVLFMGLLYHLRHPLLALDLLREYVAGDLLVFQSLMRGSPTIDRIEPDYPFSETAAFGLAGYPKLHFVEDRYAADPTNWWIPNAACTEAMLRSSGFTILSRPEAEVLICRRDDVPEWSRRESGELVRTLNGEAFARG